MFGDLFSRRPFRYGLRGDTYLWQAMQRRFAATPLPEDEWAVRAALAEAFRDLTGEALESRTGDIFVRAFRTGSGMSDGSVSGSWWYSVGQALILDRWAAAQ